MQNPVQYELPVVQAAQPSACTNLQRAQCSSHHQHCRVSLYCHNLAMAAVAALHHLCMAHGGVRIIFMQIYLHESRNGWHASSCKIQWYIDRESFKQLSHQHASTCNTLSSPHDTSIAGACCIARAWQQLRLCTICAWHRGSESS